METEIIKVEEITGKDSWISSIYGSIAEAVQHASTRNNPCRFWRLADNYVWHGFEIEGEGK